MLFVLFIIVVVVISIRILVLFFLLSIFQLLSSFLSKKSIGKGLYPAGALGISEQQSGCASEWEVERYKTKSALCLKRHRYILSK